MRACDDLARGSAPAACAAPAPLAVRTRTTHGMRRARIARPLVLPQPACPLTPVVAHCPLAGRLVGSTTRSARRAERSWSRRRWQGRRAGAGAAQASHVRAAHARAGHARAAGVQAASARDEPTVRGARGEPTGLRPWAHHPTHIPPRPTPPHPALRHACASPDPAAGPRATGPLAIGSLAAKKHWLQVRGSDHVGRREDCGVKATASALCRTAHGGGTVSRRRRWACGQARGPAGMTRMLWSCVAACVVRVCLCVVCSGQKHLYSQLIQRQKSVLAANTSPRSCISS